MVLNRILELLKPEGLQISATPCMGERPFLNGVVSTLSKTGIIPKMKSFKFIDMENFLTRSDLKLMEKECLHKTSNQFFIVAKK